MTEYKPLVSIIIAVYNGSEYLHQAIESILNQTYKNYELIVIDGGSTDNTLAIIDKYRNYISYTISEKDNGIYDAWNKGINNSKGDWISFIGSDDILYPHAFESYIEHIACRKDKGDLEFVSSKIDLVSSNLILSATVGSPWEWTLFKKNMITWHVGTFHSRSLFKKYGLFNDSYKVSGDYELLLRPKNLLKTSYIAVSTVMMRNGGVSATLLYKAIDETYRAKIENGILTPTWGTILKYNNKLKLFIKSLLVRTRLVDKI